MRDAEGRYWCVEDCRDASPAEDPRSLSDAEKLARAVLLFFRGGRWTAWDTEMWRELTGTDNATTRTLGEMARRVRDREEKINAG